MKITPYQVVFKVPDGSSNSPVFGIPDMSSLIEVRPEQDGTYVFHTHEKTDDTKHYYQIVFRITDSSPFSKDELHLSLSNSEHSNNDQQAINDLYHDKKRDLWYQRSKYCYNKKTDQWEIKINSRKNTYSVDCITTAGVFKVKVLRNSSLLSESDFNCPWVYVLPSSVSKDDYIKMLSDLMELNEQLVLREKSSVGIGSISSVESETNSLRKEIEDTKNLLNSVKGAMALPSELLGKKYKKTTINKIHHFDAKVVQDYLKYGMSGQVSGVEYYEDHDTYENRVIKSVLQGIKSSLKKQFDKLPMTTDELEKEAYRKTENDVEFLKRTRVDYNPDRAKIFSRNKEELKRRNDNIKAKLELVEHRRHLVSLLDDKWFNHISTLNDLSEIRPTPKFIANRYYSEIYKIITRNYIDKPFLSSDFQVNSFGVTSTHQVYEYWVLYKMLLHLTDIGFVISDYRGIKEHFRRFQCNKSLGPLKINIERKTSDHCVKAEFGYNVPFNSKANPTDSANITRTPDYYLKIINGNSNSWYFFDAKYKDFEDDIDDGSKINYTIEIRDVAIKKYIKDIGAIFNSNPEYNSSESDIKGSYIVMANIDEFPEKNTISKNNRLFGSNLCIPYDGKKELPIHRYGAIVLSPSNDTELTTLFLLIFEYLETHHDKNHKNYDWCWKCNATNLSEIKENLSTAGGNKKYYTTCSVCGDFRVITNCSGVRKHILIKHAENNFHCQEFNNPWAFVCPVCCNSL